MTRNLKIGPSGVVSRLSHSRAAKSVSDPVIPQLNMSTSSQPRGAIAFLDDELLCSSSTPLQRPA